MSCCQLTNNNKISELVDGRHCSNTKYRGWSLILYACDQMIVVEIFCSNTLLVLQVLFGGTLIGLKQGVIMNPLFEDDSDLGQTGAEQGHTSPHSQQIHIDINADSKPPILINGTNNHRKFSTESSTDVGKNFGNEALVKVTKRKNYKARSVSFSPETRDNEITSKKYKKEKLESHSMSKMAKIVKFNNEHSNEAFDKGDEDIDIETELRNNADAEELVTVISNDSHISMVHVDNDFDDIAEANNLPSTDTSVDISGSMISSMMSLPKHDDIMQTSTRNCTTVPRLIASIGDPSEMSSPRNSSIRYSSSTQSNYGSSRDISVHTLEDISIISGGSSQIMEEIRRISLTDDEKAEKYKMRHANGYVGNGSIVIMRDSITAMSEPGQDDVKITMAQTTDDAVSYHNPC